jgi:lysozyme family protein
MSDAIDTILDGVIAREGGYVDNSLDRGGPTKFGITQRTLSDWLGRAATPGDVQALTGAVAREIYRREYVERPGFALVPHAGLQELLVDCAINHGQDRAVRWLQDALGVTADGQFGTHTKDALDHAIPEVIYNLVLATRIRFYGHIITHDHSQALFAEGWLNRAASFVDRTA